MKKTLKIVVPILLVLALLAAGYWFFFQYRTDLTTGLLTDFADSQLASGHYSMAIRCYGWAHSLTPQDVDLSLKLAEAYRAQGNYTKTENVLVHAIYDAPGETRLYETLSRVYVEQDKLLDAQQMLDSVAEPQVQAELSARRPQAPTVEPPADFYSDYITVEVRAASGRLFCTVDGSYPSLAAEEFPGSVQLPGGTTTLCAIAVGEDGLVSPAVYASYTVAGVIEEVQFRDQALEALVRQLLNRPERPIYTDDLWDIEALTLPQDLASTEDLRYFTGLKELLGLDMGELDYSFLAHTPELTSLELEGCALNTEALTWIAGCPKLEVLILANCGLANIEPLRALTELRLLDLSGNSIGDISPLTEMAKLEELYMGHNALTTLPLLRKLTSLRILDLSYNALEYVGSVSACTGVERLNVSHNRLTSVTAVSALTKLVWLNASSNKVTEVTALTPCTELESFLMSDNKLTDVSFLSGCSKIREVNIDYNDVVSVPAFQADCPLEIFSAAHNFLEDLGGLAGLQRLSIVNADYNNIRDISVLIDCPSLTLVNVYGTYIRSGGELAENGVVVNFTPSF